MNIEPLRALWDGHAKAVYAYLLRLTRSEADAKDFLQDLFCRIAREPALLEKLRTEPRGYLLRLARNAVVDHVRRGQALERIFTKIQASRPEETVDAGDPDLPQLRRALAHALQELPEEQRVVVHARLWKRHTLDEIAGELDVSINTAASRYRYGLDKMRGALRSLYEDFAPKASPQPNPAMKKKSVSPFTQPEAPIIQRLEQRRVPSATGAVFALPVVPAPEDHAEDDGGEIGAPVEDELVKDAPEEEIIEVGLEEEILDFPVSFEDVRRTLEGGTDDSGVLDDPAMEGVTDENVFWIASEVFTDPADETGEIVTLDDPVESAESGEEVVDPRIFWTFAPTDTEDGAVEDPATDGGESEGEPNIFFPLNPDAKDPDAGVDDGGDPSHSDTKPDDDGAVSDPGDVIFYTMGAPSEGAHAAGGGGHGETHDPTAAETSDMVKRGGDHPADEAAEPVTHHTAAADSAHHEIPAAPQGTPVLLTAADPAQAIELGDFSSPAFVVVDGHASIATDPVHFAGLPAANLEASHDLAALSIEPIHQDLHVASLEVETAFTAATAAAPADGAIDQWVPLHELSGASLPDGSHADNPIPVEQELDHALAHADVSSGNHSELRASSMPMAATGALLLAADRKREQEKKP